MKSEVDLVSYIRTFIEQDDYSPESLGNATIQACLETLKKWGIPYINVTQNTSMDDSMVTISMGLLSDGVYHNAIVRCVKQQVIERRRDIFKRMGVMAARDMFPNGVGNNKNLIDKKR